MTTARQPLFRTRPRVFGTVLALTVAVVFVAANAHLVFVSFASRPDCVLSQTSEGAPTFRAAKPSC